MTGRPSTLTIIFATLVAAGAAYCLDASERRRWPKATPPPPPSPIYQEVDEPMPTPEEIERAAAEHTARLQYEIEQALAGDDEDRIQAVFVFLLPELLQLEPVRVVNLLEKMKAGEPRDRLRDAVARQWVVMDQRATMEWIENLDDDDRRASARQALATLRPIDPAAATSLDVSLERLTSR